LRGCSSTEATPMSISEITGSDLFKRDGVVAVIHDRLRERRRIGSVDVLKAPDHISGSVGRFPGMAGFRVSFERKLPARRMIMEKVGNAAPIDVISGVGAGSLG